MAQGPEDIAREQIDRMLEQAGWDVQDVKTANIWAKKGVAIREFELKSGYGTADYLALCRWSGSRRHRGEERGQHAYWCQGGAYEI